MTFTVKWAYDFNHPGRVGYGSNITANAALHLSDWSANPFIFAYDYNGPGKHDTPALAVQSFIDNHVPTILAENTDYERVSYPQAQAGPGSEYIPDHYPTYSEYTATVQAYIYSYTIYRTNDTPITSFFVVFSGVSPDDIITPPVSPDPVTLQIFLSEDSKLYPDPAHTDILPQYIPGVNFIRGSYDSGNKVGVIRTAYIPPDEKNPLPRRGFMIYQESPADTPFGNIYVYDNKRALHAVVDASQIGIYL